METDWMKYIKKTAMRNKTRRRRMTRYVGNIGKLNEEVHLAGTLLRQQIASKMRR